MQFGRKKSFIEQAQGVAEDVLSATAEALTEAREKAGPALADTREKAAPVIAEARERATEKALEAKEKAAPMIAEARTQAATRTAEARSKAAPVIAEARERATERALEAKEAGAVRLAELRGEEPPKRSRGIVKKVLVVTGLAAVGGIVFSVLRGKKEDNWESSYQPSSAPSTAGQAPEGGLAAAATQAQDEESGDDAAGSVPGESIADQNEEPHPASTPDEPAEVVDVEGEDESKA
jgi:hypothetical protein